MYPVELDLFSRRERCKGLLREAAAERLAQECVSGECRSQDPAQAVIGWLGYQIVKLGSRLHHS